MSGTPREKTLRNQLFGKRNAVAPTFADGEFGQLQIDENGNLLTASSGAGQTVYSLNDLEDAAVSYFGYEDPSGKWLIKKFTDATGAMRYANVSNNLLTTDYETAWTNRATLTFDLFNVLTNY